MALAFVFPGQGSQAPGMGRDLAEAFPAAREVFQEVDDALKQKLSKLMFEGQAIDITLTSNAQPALMAVSVAVVRVLEKEGGFDLASKVALVAGHSLGEYSALTAARAFDLATAARLLRLRGDAMQAATPPGTGAMAALLGADTEQALAICEAAKIDPETEQAEVLEIANDNGGGQIVISGAAGAVERALMAPAADAMAEALDGATIRAPVVPVVANVSAAKATDPAEIRRLLVSQVTATVRWRECVAAMAAMGCDRFVEVGTGKVLTGLMKRNAPEATASAIGTPADVEAFLKTI
jgi:[acyl-carrier-protein] S-malonyltransferase